MSPAVRRVAVRSGPVGVVATLALVAAALVPVAAPLTASATPAASATPTVSATPAASATTTPVVTSATVHSAPSTTVFAGGPFHQPDSQPAKYAASLAAAGDAAGSAAASSIARQPIAIWLGDWFSDTQLVKLLQTTQAAAARAGTTPVYVTYAIPNRDCGGYSAGGMTADRYQRWTDLIASTLRGQRATVIVEPDSLAALSNCPGEASTRYALLGHEVAAFTAAGVPSYLDAGNSNWVPPAEMANRLRNAGVANARGFSSNVANYHPTVDEQAYDQKVSALTGGAHYVIDTSRNGAGWRGTWCNGPGAGLGAVPRTVSDGTALDALLWVKTPGASDGTCAGGPPAGAWYSSYAQTLVRNAVLQDALTSAAVDRVAGSDAYDTAARIALRAFPTPRTVYVASRATFADALGAGAAAGHDDAPVLLTAPGALPSATAAALTAMSPDTVVVVGGPAAVSDTVVDQLRRYAGTVARVSGADRFATSAAVSAGAFAPGVEVAYVATGTNFPDALSGAAIAASVAANGPMLLVTPTSVPATVAAELRRLAPERIVVLGGAGVVSDGVVASLAGVTASAVPAAVSRWSGPDRFGTSADIAARAYPSGVDSRTVYVATGTAFPDALAAAPAAGRTGSPLLLVTSDSIPDPIVAAIGRIDPTRVVVLGGSAAVSDAVAARL
ncbi:glycoside hydrolase family 6 protein [Curtobacterium sp. RRHDQ10]|uniref:glycoside hydrolase family 6 protein n=1 Tax=Curtobacterium phyllosphaerae TaxID=3413379 RepID=UPI003BF2B856